MRGLRRPAAPGPPPGGGRAVRLATAVPVGTPTRLHLLIAIVVVGGAVAVAGAFAAAWQTGPPTALHLALAAVVVAAGDVSLVHIRFGSNRNSLTWAEASVIVGAALVGWSWLAVVGTATLLVRQAVIRRGPVKTLYNAASFPVGVLAGAGVYRLVTGTWSVVHPDSLRTAAGLAAAAATYFLWITVVISGAVALSQHMSVRSVYGKDLQQRLVMFLGNGAVGLLAVVLDDLNPTTFVLTAIFLLLLYQSYHGYLLAQQDRDTWRELQASTAALMQVDQSGVANEVIARTQALLAAEYVELLLVDDLGGAPVRSYRTHSAAEGPDAGIVAEPPWLRALAMSGPQVVDVGSCSDAQREQLRALNLQTLAITPLMGSRGYLGTFLVGFRGVVRLSEREIKVLATFANQVASSLQNARLFEELADQETRLRAIVDNSSDGILLVDAAGTVQAWNSAMVRMTGTPADVAVGAPLENALPAGPADDQPLTGAWLEERLGSAADFRAEVRLHRGSATRDVALSVSAVRSSTGSYEAAVVVARDVTAARELDEAKTDFIATVSHELRTPLTPIKGYLMMLLRPHFAPDPATLHRYHSRMLEQTTQLERMIADLLSVSSLQRGAFSIRLEPVDVDALVAGVVQAFATHSDRAVDYRPGPRPVRASCDGARLEQVLANLLSNAEKFSPPGAPVSIAVGRVDGKVVVRVHDHGPGIPADQRELVFEPFRRLGDHTTRETRGTGLGLHIARELVTAMSGDISVADAVGGGAVFTVTLPAAGPVAAPVPAASTAS